MARESLLNVRGKRAVVAIVLKLILFYLLAKKTAWALEFPSG
jgi:hypothetical protein